VGLAVIAAVGFAVLAPATSASAGSVGSGPLTLTVKDSPFVVKGTQESLSDFYCGPGGEIIQGATVRQAVSASSPYGIASWDVAPNYDYDYPGPWTHYAQSAAPKIQYAKDNYSDDCGGGIHNGRGVFVRVTDTHGNVAELAELESLYFLRWDNTTAAYDGSTSNSSFSFGTAWSAYNPCAQCDNGSTIYSTKAGASALYTLNSTWSNHGGIGAHLGLAMTKGPGHGAVKLYLDGVLKATVDTYSATWKYRNYVYDFGPLTIGAHTVKLVNVGTVGRPRIDVQGMALVVGYTYVPTCDPDSCPTGPGA
jgi:hypothetical protein